MFMNKYLKNTVLINGDEHDRAKVVFRPKEKWGEMTTTDGTKYERDPKTGQLRRKK